MKRYDVTHTDVGITEQMTEAQARKRFGKNEWIEIKQGYLPNLIVMEVTQARDRQEEMK